MILPVIGTIGTRVLIAAMNLLVVAVSSRYLGLEGVGTIALIILGVTFVQLGSNVVGGSGLVYLVPRHGARALRWPSYAWALIVAVFAWLVLQRWALVPAGFETPTVTIAFLRSLTGIHTNLLLGRERYGAQNALLLAQAAMLSVAFFILLQTERATIMDYVHAAWIADGSIALLSGLLIVDHAPRSIAASHPLTELFRQGAMAQLANGLQLLNYRYAYFLVERAHGLASLGLYSLTTQLAESAWLAPKSMGTVLYARVSNMSDVERQRDLSLVVLKIAVAVALFTVVALMIVPETLYQLAFGSEAVGIAQVVCWMAPGLIAMSASQALSHYLSGSGRVHHNTIGSGIGLLVTVIAGHQLVAAYGTQGAAITASAAYCTSFLYQAIIFNRLTGARMRHYLPDAQDTERVRIIWNRLRGR